MGGGSKTTAQQRPQFPTSVGSFIEQMFGQAGRAAGAAPLEEFAAPHPETIVGPDPNTLAALDYYKSLASGGATPGILDAFNRLQLPLIQQQAMLAGQGTSGALPAAEAMGQSNSIMQALQLQSGAAGQEASIGDYLRQIAQAQADAPFQDFLRRQGIGEELMGAASGAFPSTVSQIGKQKVAGEGIWGWLIGSGAAGGK